MLSRHRRPAIRPMAASKGPPAAEATLLFAAHASSPFDSDRAAKPEPASDSRRGFDRPNDTFHGPEQAAAASSSLRVGAGPPETARS